jgi:fructokinase
MKKILCIGEALIDMICTDKNKSLAEGQNFLKKPGGAPTNVAAAIGALGGNVELAAKVGADPFGRQLTEVMREFNVNTKWVWQDPDHFTTLAFVSLLENGERDFYFNRGADGQLNSKETDTIDITEFSIVHFGSATAFLPGPLQATYLALLQKCLQKKIFISFDPNYRRLLFQNNTQTFIDQSWNFLRSCHFFKVSDEEAVLITGKATVNEAAELLLKKTKAVFAITLGKEGALLGIKGRTILVPSIKIKPVDTTGAGDAFVGATLYQLNSFGPKKILQLSEKEWAAIFFNANKAGARTCEYMGAMEAFKHLSRDIFDS